MKKIIIIFSILFLVVGCGKYGKEDVIKDLESKVNSSDSYLLKGSLEIYRNEDLYTYNVESAYQKKNKFKVTLVNTTNNHKQVILKNNDGVYVETPSLNKNFKFQSEWPYNNSQIYLLQPIISDLQSDDDIKYQKEKNGYILTFKANYINNRALINQKVYLDNNLKLKKVEVLDSDKAVVMRFKITKYKMNYKFDKSYFDLEVQEFNPNLNTKNSDQKNKENDNNKDENKQDNNIVEKNNETSKNDQSEESNTRDTNVASTTDEVLYPMYLPVNTYLDSQDVISLDDSKKTILTFSGDKPFTLIQSNVSDYLQTNINGDPDIVFDTVGAIMDSSVTWISNDTEYYLTSESMDTNELLLVAQSLNVTAVGK